MRLTKQAIEEINIPKIRMKIALQLDCSERTMARMIDENKDNGLLTTVAALLIIRTETKLVDEQILEEVSEAVK